MVSRCCRYSAEQKRLAPEFTELTFYLGRQRKTKYVIDQVVISALEKNKAEPKSRGELSMLLR